MTREELFRAVGEVREDQIAEHFTRCPWKRYGALAACLVAVLAGVFGWNRLYHTGWDLPFAAEDGGFVDGSDYSAPESAEDSSPSPVYSANVEIGELDGSADHGKTASDASACLVWLDPEEVFSMDTVIFRGVVRNLRYYTVTAGGTELSYTVASVEVTSSLRGDLAKGDICGVLYLGAPGRLSTSIVGDLEDLEIGSEAIFMPFWATEETGWRDGEAYFCYADLAEFYLSEGIRFLFLDTGDGLSFARDVYTDIADAKTLDEVEDYIRDMLTEL